MCTTLRSGSWRTTVSHTGGRGDGPGDRDGVGATAESTCAVPAGRRLPSRGLSLSGQGRAASGRGTPSPRVSSAGSFRGRAAAAGPQGLPRECLRTSRGAGLGTGGGGTAPSRQMEPGSGRIRCCPSAGLPFPQDVATVHVALAPFLQTGP